ncbi:phosphoribosylamine--glycine ligase [Candidatus Endolissoclinum faulkneri L5]|uniref:Phosphoribosylamine--glycine ligase n=1 Tax=Candidatus Endolissoclinum faulkneri L5 TaxID=1401328 RepID=V9TTG0_9PROT|nr:phosphoribosylamine--glycine ligase [Candidatus Endolissoclinum faulkneri]AHC73886.1 phosphoribosylamine--glycine ligase [Candidatus Endolissoclinum faulkneri L5]
MRILVVGSGGREHAMCWAISGSPFLTKLFCAPGNAGIEREAECVSIAADDYDGLVAFCIDKVIDFVVIGPEGPLVDGLVDKLGDAGIQSFGPNAAAATLEGSKVFAKDFCIRHNIPTASYAHFTDADTAKAYIRKQSLPIVIKTDGLAAGKGVFIAERINQAMDIVDRIMIDGVFGKSGKEIIIEECMIGQEVSFFTLTDGDVILPMISAQDYKRVGEGDTGPNTGGMGACSPAPIIDDLLSIKIINEIISPTIAGMAAEGRKFRGVLYAGLMITDSGPKVIEYNVRFGDPECQALILLLKSDFLSALIATTNEKICNIHLNWHDYTSLCVVMASRGYPGSYQKNSVINKISEIESDDVVVFHAGTSWDREGRLLATGGRVLGITALGKNIVQAREKVYSAINKIDWPEGFNRHDIACHALNL